MWPRYFHVDLQRLGFVGFVMVVPLWLVGAVLCRLGWVSLDGSGYTLVLLHGSHSGPTTATCSLGRRLPFGKASGPPWTSRFGFVLQVARVLIGLDLSEELLAQYSTVLSGRLGSNLYFFQARPSSRSTQRIFQRSRRTELGPSHSQHHDDV
jgi:hypothetical protein